MVITACGRKGLRVEARYLRIKNWGELQHYSKRRPSWIKLYARLLIDDRFIELNECERGQLMMLWVVASQSSRFTVDRAVDKVVPVIQFDEKSLRKATRGTKKIPLEKFINDGWLVLVSESELVDSSVAEAVNHALFEVKAASTPLANGYQDASRLEQRTENIKTKFFAGAVDNSLWEVSA